MKSGGVIISCKQIIEEYIFQSIKVREYIYHTIYSNDYCDLSGYLDTAGGDNKNVTWDLL